MEEILSFIDPTKYNAGSRYVYNEVNVPRVTEILSAMLHEDYLMEWSNSIGLYQHKKYKDTLQLSADIGSYVHDAIEKYLSDEVIFNKDIYPSNIREQINTAFNSFLEWWTIIKKTKYKILMQEEKLVCQYFGGTLDMLIEINGLIYIVDFKTSNHPSYKYFLQLSAYKYMLENNYGVHINGCIILMLNKKECRFTEMVLDFNIQEHLDYINLCQQSFLSLVYAYYNRVLVQSSYQNIFGGGLNGRGNRNAR